MSNKHQRVIYGLLGDKIVAYHAIIARALGSVKAGILICQLLFWDGKGADKYWTYKTADDLYMETALTRNEQDTAIRICKNKGILEVKLKGIPAKRHFHINKEKLVALLLSFMNSTNLVSRKAENSGSAISKTTSYSKQINNTNIDILNYGKKYLNNKFKA
ncbi:MAG: hypothetical protein WCS89_02045 [Candidatus Paceibacterota bacterium]